MKPNIEMTATYDTVLWEEEDEEPTIGGGFTDPHNPWGGFKAELPENVNASDDWYVENVQVVDNFDTLTEAAQFVVDFPGAVWDLWPDCDESINPYTGEYTRVMLHVKGKDAGVVLKLAERMKARTDRKMKVRQTAMTTGQKG